MLSRMVRIQLIGFVVGAIATLAVVAVSYVRIPQRSASRVVRASEFVRIRGPDQTFFTLPWSAGGRSCVLLWLVSDGAAC